MSYFFSIVIPVYNTEQYLPRALDSILKQTFDIKKIEVVVVNDGSPKAEECKNIIKEYEKKLNVKFIDNEKNHGLFLARKIGVAHVSNIEGYLLHLDSDDYLDESTCKSLYEDIQKNGDADYIEFDYYELNKNIKKKSLIIKDTCERNTKSILSYEQNHTIWNKCYKTSFIKDIYINMPNFYSYYNEDYYQMGIIDHYVKTRRKLNKYLYIYVKDDGITNIKKYDKEKLRKIFISIHNVEKYLCDFYINKNFEVYIQIIENYSCSLYSFLFNIVNKNDFFDVYIEILGIEKFKTFIIYHSDNLNRILNNRDDTIRVYQKRMKLLHPIKIFIKPFRNLYRLLKNTKEV